jgi:hypothetical protein
MTRPLPTPRPLQALALALTASALLLAGCGEKLAKGTTVAAKEKTSWYLATVVSQDGDDVKVRYYDQTEATLPRSEVKLPLAKKEIKDGADVMAVWKTGRFYMGTVKSVTKTGALIRWHDGSPPSESEFGKIVAP